MFEINLFLNLHTYYVIGFGGFSCFSQKTNIWGGQMCPKIPCNSWLFKGSNIKLHISKEAM